MAWHLYFFRRPCIWLVSLISQSFNTLILQRYLSSTVILLFTSYQMHNVVAWMKIKPFLPKWGVKVYICTLIAVQPYWIAELYLNFEYFNDLGNRHSSNTRPWEALARDPWWIFTTCRLIYDIKRGYFHKLIDLIRISPRFGILIFCMVLSICFLLVDVIVTAAKISRDSGINPYWRVCNSCIRMELKANDSFKMALVFKCASDTIFLDDFKSVLDNIVKNSLGKAGGAAHRGRSGGQVVSGSQDIGSSAPKPANPGFGPVVTIHSDNPRLDTRSKWKARLFPSRDEGIAGRDMSIQRETTITLSNLKANKSSEGSFGSGNRILPMPEPASHAQRSDK